MYPLPPRLGFKYLFKQKTNGLMPGTYVYIYEYAGSNLQDVQ